MCMECGLVLTDYAFMDKEIKPEKWAQSGNNVRLPIVSSINTSCDGTQSDSCGEEKEWNLDILQRVCDNFFIPRCVEDRVIHLLSTNDYVKKRNGRSDRDELLIAFALYTSCLKEDCAKTSELITSWFQIDPKGFWNVANEFGYCPRKIMPSDILKIKRAEIVLLSDDMSFKMMQYIASVSDGLTEKLTHSPSVILASVLYLFLNERKARSVCVRKVAKICNVSITSVNQLKKSLREMDIFAEEKVRERERGGQESSFEYYFEREEEEESAS